MPSLIHVLFLFRHGDRSPISSYIGDHFFMSDEEKSYWAKNLPASDLMELGNQNTRIITNDGDEPVRPTSSGGRWPNGQLTQAGATQMYQKGQYLRQKYQEYFASISCHSETLYIRSTNIQRTIQSVQHLLRGMFPEAYQEQQEEPLFHIRTRYPFTLAAGGTKKPIHMEHVLEQFRLTKQEDMELKSLEDTIREHAGIHPEKNISWTHVREVLVCRKAHHLPFPKGITMEHYDQILKHNAQEWEWVYSHPEFGPLLFEDGVNEIYETLRNIIEKKTTYAASFFSAHDSTLVAFYCSLGIQMGKIPHYGAMCAIEVYEDAEASYFLKFVFDDGEETIWNFTEFQEQHPLYSFKSYEALVQRYKNQ